MAQHSFMVPLRPTLLQFDMRTQKENRKIVCIYPLHYNIINHRDKGEGKKKGKRVEANKKKRDNDASAYTNFKTENL